MYVVLSVSSTALVLRLAVTFCSQLLKCLSLGNCKEST